MLKPGSEAPEFNASDSSGNDVTLSSLLRDGPLILYFYPADFTPGCTKEACSIRDMHDDILNAGLQVIGVSPQDAESHERFREQHGLPFRLLCDPEKSIVSLYEVDGPMGFGVRRATYLIGQDRRIVDAIQADIRIDRHNQFIEQAIAMRKSAPEKRSGQVQSDSRR